MAKGIVGNVLAKGESGGTSPEAVGALERSLSSLKLVRDNQDCRTGSEQTGALTDFEKAGKPRRIFGDL